MYRSRLARKNWPTPSTVLGPETWGVTTTFGVDGNGYLHTITNPNNEVVTIVHQANGLIQNLQLHRLFDIYATPRIALEEIERHGQSMDDETRTTREAVNGDAPLVGRQPDWQYNIRPAPCSQRATACCGN